MQAYSAAAEVYRWQISLYLGPAQCEIKQCFCPQQHPLVFVPAYPYQDLSELMLCTRCSAMQNVSDNCLLLKKHKSTFALYMRLTGVLIKHLLVISANSVS